MAWQSDHIKRIGTFMSDFHRLFTDAATCWSTVILRNRSRRPSWASWRWPARSSQIWWRSHPKPMATKRVTGSTTWRSVRPSRTARPRRPRSVTFCPSTSSPSWSWLFCYISLLFSYPFSKCLLQSLFYKW